MKTFKTTIISIVYVAIIALIQSFIFIKIYNETQQESLGTVGNVIFAIIMLIPTIFIVVSDVRKRTGDEKLFTCNVKSIIIAIIVCIAIHFVFFSSTSAIDAVFFLGWQINTKSLIINAFFSYFFNNVYAYISIITPMLLTVLFAKK